MENIELFDKPVNQYSQISKSKLDDIQCELLVQQIIKNFDIQNYWENKKQLVIIEPGTGTGKLSLYLSKQFKSEDNFSQNYEKNQIIRDNLKYDHIPTNTFTYIFIERDAGYKQNYDNTIRRNGSKVYRFKADIKDIDLQFILNWNQQQQQIEQYDSIVIAKHCCNGGTDGVLNWIKTLKNKPKLVLIALCCHCKGDGSGYINQQYCQELEISQQLLHLMHKSCSWQFAFTQHEQLTEKQQQKFILGQKSRLILDIGRCLWLENQGYQVKLIRYCDRSITQECYCIIGKLV